jgi:hypothetical protein
MDARGLTDGQLVEGARRSMMHQLAAITLAVGKVMVF